MAKECRFCLESETTEKNPFIEPCICSGIGQFVHIHCLRKWALIEPDSNAKVCSICKTPFTINLIPDYEIIPMNDVLSLTILNRTTIFGSLLYIVIFLYDESSEYRGDRIKFAQFLYQLVFAISFIRNHSVINVNEYRTKILYGFFPTLISTWLYFSLHLVYTDDVSICFLINVNMNLLWKEHLRVLDNINRDLRLM
jgi:hypothetical protein